MERYRILDHAADAKLRAFGSGLEEAFANAALGLASLMTDWEKVEPRVAHDATVEAPDLEGLLVRFLSEILYLSDAKSFVLAGVEAVRIEEPRRSSEATPEARGSGGGGGGSREVAPGASPWRLSARFVGDDRPERYDFHGDVKAVTYSEIKIERSACGDGECPGPWMVQVVVDL